MYDSRKDTLKHRETVRVFLNSIRYKLYIQEIKPALVHHNENNTHHPEHWEDGIIGMNLIDLIEMLADWKAATLRMKNKGNIRKSLEINKKRFKIPEPLYQVLKNTINEMGW